MKNCCSIIELLNKAGIEATPHRKQILEVFDQEQRAVTPKYILSRVRENQPIDKVTLYRILDLFVSKRIVRRIASSNGLLHYEIHCDDHFPTHPHFVCRQCGEIQCLNDMSIEKIKTQIENNNVMRQSDIDLKLEGICLKCERKEKLLISGKDAIYEKR